MADQLNDAPDTAADQELPVGFPRRGSTARKEAAKQWSPRQFEVPNERRTDAGTLVFRTHDRQVYARLDSGEIRRSSPKVNGKMARKARALARKQLTGGRRAKG